jgi:HAD-superfamily hydrolase, subfamily IIB
MERSKKRIALFDVDGTLTKPRNNIESDMVNTLRELKKKIYVAVVGGSDLKKVSEQMGEFFPELDYCFTENGLYSLKEGKLFHKMSIKDALGEDRLKQFINFCLRYIADLDIPIKRGTFIEYRNGMINVSPIGRNCSQEERDEFEKYDNEKKIRAEFVKTLKEKFADFNLSFAIGGQISFDVYPKGWDKTYCLQFLDEFEEIYFFGDKTFEGGNDYEIYTHERTKGYSVKNPQETIKLLHELFLDKEE